MKQDFVTFYSPGTFVSESTTQPIDEWDVNKAIDMSKSIKERYGALPYGFQFSTNERGDNDLNSHETKRSPMYYLGGQIFTLEQLKLKNDPDDRILISNMESNKLDKIIVNTNSWKFTGVFHETDIVLQFEE